MNLVTELELFFPEIKVPPREGFYLKERLIILSVKPLLNKLCYFNVCDSFIEISQMAKMGEWP